MHVVTNGVPTERRVSTGDDTDCTGVNLMSQTKRTGRMIKPSAVNAFVAGVKKIWENKKVTKDKRDVSDVAR